MPSRRDGRVEPGQPLRTAFSASAWNRAQDAADVVLGQRPGFGADGPAGGMLPSLRTKLPLQGYFGQVACWLGGAQSSQQNLLSVSQAPASPSKTWEYSVDEKRLPVFGAELLQLTDSGGLWTVTTLTRETAATEPAMAICTDNRSYVWALSGLAIARVRVFNWAHRYARLAMQFPGSTNQQNTDAAGCLDSAFYGPAKVLGYAQINVNGFLFGYPTGSIGGDWPTFQLRWALVQF